MDLREFIELAYLKFNTKKKWTFRMSPISLLYSLEWETNDNESRLSQEDLAALNVAFSQESCYGRVVKAAVLSEIYFPKAKMYAGEVLISLTRSLVLPPSDNDQWNDTSYMNMVLNSEVPHIILVDEQDHQFDSQFIGLPGTRSLKHQVVEKYDLWEMLFAEYLNCQSVLLEENDPDRSFSLRDQAFNVCPNLVSADIGLARLYLRLDQNEKAAYCLERALEKGPNARNLSVLWHLTNKIEYKERFIEIYDERLLDYIDKMYEN